MRVRAVPLARALVQMGHQVKIIMPPWHVRELPAVWQEQDIEYEYVAVNRLPLLGYLLTTRRLVQSALAFKPDVIHCFKPKAFAGLAACFIWLRKKLGLRVRLVVDEDDWEGAGGWNEVEPYPTGYKHFFTWQERWGLRHCDCLTVASRTLQSIAWSMGIPPKKVIYLPNGAVEIERAVKQNSQKTGYPIVLCYTRFVEFSPERLLIIWRKIHRELPGANLLIVGKALDPVVEKRLDDLLMDELAGSIWRVGWVPAPDLPVYFSSADIAIFPCDDNLINRCKCSVKLTDLLTAGVVVVADAVGQNCEYIEHRSSGWLVSPGDSEAMAAAVIGLLQDDELRRSLGENARARMLSNYSWSRLAGEAWRAYSASPSP